MDRKYLIQNEIEKIIKYSRMLKGNIYKVKKTCKNKNCKCHLGEKHVNYQLTYKGENNITKTVYVSSSQVNKIKNYISNYKKAKAAFEKILKLNVELLKSKET